MDERKDAGTWCFVCGNAQDVSGGWATVFLYKYAVDGVATISRLLKITGLFCKRALQKR